MIPNRIHHQSDDSRSAEGAVASTFPLTDTI
jgi:hypothetical protein